MKSRFLLVVAIILGTAIGSQAQVSNQRNQPQRIKQGVRSGQISKREAHRIVHNQRDLRQDKRLARADGTITPAERKILKREQRMNKRRIHRARHN